MSETTTPTNRSLTNCIEEHGGINSLIYISRYCTKKCKVTTFEIKSFFLFSIKSRIKAYVVGEPVGGRAQPV